MAIFVVILLNIYIFYMFVKIILISVFTLDGEEEDSGIRR